MKISWWRMTVLGANQTRLLAFAIVTFIVLLQTIRGLTFANPELGDGRSQQLLGHDFRWIYASGRSWIQGVSPHVPEKFMSVWEAEFDSSPSVCGYPPTVFVVSVPVAMFTWGIAHYLYDAFNILAFAATLFYLFRIVQFFTPQTPAWRYGLGLAAAAAFGSISGIIYAGQTSLIVTAALSGMIYHTLHRQTWIAALLMVLASIKPNLSLLPFVWLCVWNPSLFHRSVITVGITCAISVATAWDPHALSGLFESLEIYRGQAFNRLENSSVALIRFFGTGPIGWVAPLCGVVLTALLAFRFRHSRGLMVTLPMLLTAVLMPIQSYDMALLMIPACLLIAMAWSWWYLPALPLIMRPNIVERIFEEMGVAAPDVAVLYVRWMALVMWIVALLWSQQNQDARQQPAADVTAEAT
jgi:hypothetical protein